MWPEFQISNSSVSKIKCKNHIREYRKTALSYAKEKHSVIRVKKTTVVNCQEQLAK